MYVADLQVLITKLLYTNGVLIKNHLHLSCSLQQLVVVNERRDDMSC